LFPAFAPGKKTAEYLDYVVTRLLVLGAGYLALVCLLPEMIRSKLANYGVFWWYIYSDYRQRRYGYGSTNPVAFASSPVRGLD
jgi:hypothetical protein